MVHFQPTRLAAQEPHTSAEPSAACSRCPMEFGCGDFEVCRIMCMSDEEIIASTPNAEAVADEMREVLRQALSALPEPPR